MSLTNRLLRALLPLGAGMLVSGAVQAAGEVSSVETFDSAATPFRYEADGNTYTWGLGNNQTMQGFVSGGDAFRYASSADRVELMRDDIVGVADGLPCGIFVERLGSSSLNLAADYPTDSTDTGNCDMATLLSSRIVNRGAVDLFSNRVPDAKNIERVDYLFDRGVLAPLSAESAALAGHLVAEKRGNNPVSIAAILELDVLGQPASYGPLVTIGATGCVDPELCYGLTDLQHAYAFFQNSLTAPQGFPVVTETTRETVAMAFVSSERLGLEPGQRYFGFSLFADDVDASVHDLLDPSSFPNDTSDDYVVIGDDADIYGGMTGYFVSQAISVITGRIFLDENGDGLPDADEAGISDISISLFVDVDGDGMLDPSVDTLVGEPSDSDVSGGFLLPGVDDGNYLLVLDETDVDMPPGLQLPAGSNPRPVTVSGGSPDDVNFVFVQSDATGGGSDSGSTTAGGATAGSTTGTGGGTTSGDSAGGSTGGSTGGGDTSGGDTSGQGTGTAGGDTSGTDTAGGGTSGQGTGGTSTGGDTAGGSTSGTSTAGGDTSGTDTSGNTTSGADTSGGDTAGSDTSGADTSGGGTSGTTTSGGDPSNPPTEVPRDDVNTRAVNDEFTVNQGSSDNRLDVLANDNDGAGDGLSLLSVTESPNATIEIIDGQVSYTPDPEFNGTDNFMYSMSDSDNTTLTGSVSVTVVRFSDINGNGLNDFDECNCTSLTLETGVHGSGVGRLSIELLAAMAALVLLRRRRRHATQVRMSAEARP